MDGCAQAKQVKSDFNLYPWYEESEMMCMRLKAYNELRIKNRSESDLRKSEATSLNYNKFVNFFSYIYVYVFLNICI